MDDLNFSLSLSLFLPISHVSLASIDSNDSGGWHDHTNFLNGQSMAFKFKLHQGT